MIWAWYYCNLATLIYLFHVKSDWTPLYYRKRPFAHVLRLNEVALSDMVDGVQWEWVISLLSQRGGPMGWKNLLPHLPQWQQMSVRQSWTDHCWVGDVGRSTGPGLVQGMVAPHVITKPDFPALCGDTARFVLPPPGEDCIGVYQTW